MDDVPEWKQYQPLGVQKNSDWNNELDNIPRLMVFNKVDLVSPLWAKAIAARFNGVVCSAIRQETLVRLLNEIEERVWKNS